MGSVNGSTTFFVNGNAKSCIYDEENFEAGHQIASHTVMVVCIGQRDIPSRIESLTPATSHASLVQLTDEQIDAEVERLDQALIRILGVKPRFIRPPFGDLNSHVIQYLRKKHNKIIIMWSDDSGDATGGSAQDSIIFYTSFAVDRPDYPALTLSHEVSDAGVGAMRCGSVHALASAGVQLLTVAQCIDQEPYEYVGDYQERDASWTCDTTPQHEADK
ncbi:Carbohydrate esterase 4 protein [Serendipita sp. 399]|nr:Carbohydrate esterase 4 protein [Serendipita sp. 399]